MFKNKKGQVFLLLSIVILIFLVLLSSTVYRITQSPYIEPAPNEEQLLNYVDNSISALYDLTEVILSQYSQSVSRAAIVVLIQTGVQAVEDFLFSNNLPAYISVDTDNMILRNSSTTANPTYIQTEINVSISIDSPELNYEGDFTFKNIYYLEISDIAGTENYLYLYQEKNGARILIDDGIIEITPSTTVSNLGDGSYMADLQIGQIVKATFPNNIYLWMQL